MHCGDDVDAVDLDPLAGRRTQRNVQHGAVLGEVDLLTAVHRIDALAEPGLLGELDEQAHRLVRDAVLGVVEIDADGVEGEALATVAVVGEQFAQVSGAQALVVLGKGGPSRTVAKRRSDG